MSSSSSGNNLPVNMIGSALSQLLRFLQSSTGHQLLSPQGMAVAGAIPFVASMLWHYARTVVRVVDEEHKLWIQTWISSECSRSIQRSRRVNSSTVKKRTSRGTATYVKKESSRNAEEREGDGGRFAAPKLKFQPSSGVNTWTWQGWWPVSICYSTLSEIASVEYARFGMPGTQGYQISIWFAPNGERVAKNILLKGRELYLAKRAKQTEIWICNTLAFGGGSSSVVSRPSRPLSTVIIEGNTKEDIRQDAIRFLNSETWYVEKGIPYRRGFLLYGPPGCGKTSLVTALAGDLRLPIVLISLGNNEMDDTGLTKLLSDIPRDSIVLIEDVDCAMSTPRQEEETATKVQMPPEFKGMPPAIQKRMFPSLPQKGKSALTLSGLLNAIDGVGAQEGRILFMTTNHIEKLDRALIRAGRIDAKFYLGKASKEAAGQLFDQFYIHGDDPPGEKNNLELVRSRFLEKVESGVHSFAALQGVLMNARDDPERIEEGMESLLQTS